MGNPVKDLSGQAFHDLTVISRTDNPHGQAQWLCKCVCGNETTLPSQALTSGKTKSCGCRRKRRKPLKHDCTGQRYGSLLAVGLLPKKAPDEPNKWMCRCDCGGTIEAAMGALVSGHITSCGCAGTKGSDLSGLRYGRLVVEERSGATAAGKKLWLCRCDCGRQVRIPTGALRSGNTKSCGCLKTDTTRQRSRVHGGSRSGSQHFAEYQAWAGMWQRCTNPNHASYPHYGGRGITVSEDWRDFTVFLRDMGERPYPGATVERVDNSLGYGPGNCVWETRKAQANNMRKNRVVSAFGRDFTIAQLSGEVGSRHGISYRTLLARINLGWDAEKAATEPVRGRV